MAVAAAPSSDGSLLGKVVSLASARAAARQRASRLAKFIADNLLTACALGAGVTDAFLHSRGWGLASLVPALLILDFKVRS